MLTVSFSPHRQSRLQTAIRAFLVVWMAGWVLGGLNRVSAATSDIVGFYNITVPAGNSAWVCGLVTDASYEGAAVAVSADVDGKALVQFSAPGWTVNEFNLHYAEPQTGASSGLAINVLSNTADTLKLDVAPAALSAGTVFVVRKHTTLAGMMPDGGGFQAFVDSIALHGTGGHRTYIFNSFTQTWVTLSGGVNSNNVIVRPGEGFVIQMVTGKTVMLGKGEVCHLKTTPTKIVVHPNVVNLIGQMNPLAGQSTTLNSLGLAGTMAASQDAVIPLTAGSLSQGGNFVSTGSGLVNLSNGQQGSAVSVGAGAGVVLTTSMQKTVELTPVSVTP